MSGTSFVPIIEVSNSPPPSTISSESQSNSTSIDILHTNITSKTNEKNETENSNLNSENFESYTSNINENKIEHNEEIKQTNQIEKIIQKQLFIDENEEEIKSQSSNNGSSFSLNFESDQSEIKSSSSSKSERSYCQCSSGPIRCKSKKCPCKDAGIPCVPDRCQCDGVKGKCGSDVPEQIFESRLRTTLKTNTCSQQSYTSSDDEHTHTHEHDEKQHDTDHRRLFINITNQKKKNSKKLQTDILTVMKQRTIPDHSQPNDIVQTTPPRSSYHTPNRNVRKEKAQLSTPARLSARPRSQSTTRTPSKIFSEKKVQRQNQIHELTLRTHTDRIETLEKENEQLKNQIRQLKQKVEHYERSNSKTQSEISSSIHSTQSRDGRSYAQVASSKTISNNTNIHQNRQQNNISTSSKQTNRNTCEIIVRGWKTDYNLEISKRNLLVHLNYFTKQHANEQSMNKYCTIDTNTTSFQNNIQKEFTIKSNNKLFVNKLIQIYNDRKRIRHLPIQFIDVQTQQQYPQVKYVRKHLDPNSNTNTPHHDLLPSSNIDINLFVSQLNKVTSTLQQLQNQINTISTQQIHQQSNVDKTNYQTPNTNKTNRINVHPNRHSLIVSPSTSPTNSTRSITSNSIQIATSTNDFVATHSSSARPTIADDECTNQQ